MRLVLLFGAHSLLTVTTMLQAGCNMTVDELSSAVSREVELEDDLVLERETLFARTAVGRRRPAASTGFGYGAVTRS